MADSRRLARAADEQTLRARSSVRPRRMVPVWAVLALVPAVQVGLATWQRRPLDAVLPVLGFAVAVLVLRRLLRLVRRAERRGWELERLSGTDTLTGLPNRRTWEHTLAAICRRAAAAGEPVSVLMLDLDHFKAFNDSHGHPAGDRLLQAAVRTWRAALRPADLFARWGGEEFAACLPGCDEDEALLVAIRLLAAVPLGQTVSLGLAVRLPGESPEALVARADRALYEAKTGGRARVAVAPPAARWDARAAAVHPDGPERPIAHTG